MTPNGRVESLEDPDGKHGVSGMRPLGRIVRWGATLILRPEPPGADPQAGWCGTRGWLRILSQSRGPDWPVLVPFKWSHTIRLGFGARLYGGTRVSARA